jgi:hypothetical protein
MNSTKDEMVGTDYPAAKPELSERELLEIRKLRQGMFHARIALCLSILGSALLLLGLQLDRNKTLAQRALENEKMLFQQRQESERTLEQRRVEHELRAREHQLAVFKEKREAYVALSEAACAVAACRSYEAVEKAAPEFNKIYLGRIHIIAKTDTEVITSKIAFHTALKKYLVEKLSESPEEYFGSLALDITTACRKHINTENLE